MIKPLFSYEDCICRGSNACRDCEWFDPDTKICYYEPCDYDSDIGSAIVEEMRIQNETH